MPTTDIRMNGETSPTGAKNVAIMSSIDTYVDGNEIATLADRHLIGAGDLDTDGSGWGGPIDLSAPKYQGLKGTFSFRLYGWNTGSGSGITYIRNLADVDDFEINGASMMIPEPASPALMLAVFLGVAAVRRSKK